MTSGCLDRKEVRGAIWGVHSTGTGQSWKHRTSFSGVWRTGMRRNRNSNCPLDRVLTYKKIIYLLNLQILQLLNFLCYQHLCYMAYRDCFVISFCGVCRRHTLYSGQYLKNGLMDSIQIWHVVVSSLVCPILR